MPCKSNKQLMLLYIFDIFLKFKAYDKSSLAETINRFNCIFVIFIIIVF